VRITWTFNESQEKITQSNVACASGLVSRVVLSQRADSGYDDVTGKLYHFPRQYLRAAEEAVGDGCLLYEPRRGEGGGRTGRQAYWAAARIKRVYPDQSRADHFYAELEHFLPFPNPVPFKRSDGGFWESKLDRGGGQVSKGAMGWSIRRIPDHEFSLIWTAGYAPVLSDPDFSVSASAEWGVEENQVPFERPTISQLTNRKFRDKAFSAQVRAAYDSRCAITGLKIINGGGRAEMEAAHIMPVAEDGPDSVRNGVALSRTVHWMFDRGLISIDDDYSLLKAKGRLPEGAERLFDPSGVVNVPDDEREQPNPLFLRWHREHCFKG
jgi:putative restriction endonuclease